MSTYDRSFHGAHVEGVPAPLSRRDTMQSREQNPSARLDATLEELNDHHARFKERFDARQLIETSEALKKITAELARAFGDKLDVNDEQRVADVARSYGDRLRRETDAAKKQSLERWKYTLNHFLELKRQQRELHDAHANRNVVFDRDAHRAVNAYQQRENKSMDSSQEDTAAIEAFLSGQHAYPRENLAIKVQLEEASRLHPELIQRYLLQGALDKGFLQGEAKSIGEDLLQVMQADEKLDAAKDGWYLANFGEEYRQQKIRLADVERSAVALKDWNDGGFSGYVSTMAERTRIEQRFTEDPDYARAIAAKNQADQALDEAIADVAHQLEAFLKEKDQITQNLFMHPSDKGKIDLRFLKKILSNPWDSKQTYIMEVAGIRKPEQALVAADRARSELNSARSHFFYEMSEEMREEKNSIEDRLASMRELRQQDYAAVTGPVLVEALQAHKKASTNTHRIYLGRLKSQVLEGFSPVGGLGIDRLVENPDRLVQLQKGIFRYS